MPSAPQVRHTPVERYQMFQEYLLRRAAEVTRNNLADIQNLEAWKRRRPEVRKRFLYTLGLDPMPLKTPLRPRITGELQRDGYRVENIVFESMPRPVRHRQSVSPEEAAGKLSSRSLCQRPCARALGREGAVSTSRHLVCPPRVCRNRAGYGRIRRGPGHPSRHSRSRDVVLAFARLHTGGPGGLERDPRARLPGDPARGGRKTRSGHRHFGRRSSHLVHRRRR